jgi:hypothetical protein
MMTEGGADPTEERYRRGIVEAMLGRLTCSSLKDKGVALPPDLAPGVTW